MVVVVVQRQEVDMLEVREEVAQPSLTNRGLRLPPLPYEMFSLECNSAAASDRDPVDGALSQTAPSLKPYANFVRQIVSASSPGLCHRARRGQMQRKHGAQPNSGASHSPRAQEGCARACPTSRPALGRRAIARRSWTLAVIVHHVGAPRRLVPQTTDACPTIDGSLHLTGYARDRPCERARPRVNAASCRNGSSPPTPT